MDSREEKAVCEDFSLSPSTVYTNKIFPPKSPSYNSNNAPAKHDHKNQDYLSLANTFNKIICITNFNVQFHLKMI